MKIYIVTDEPTGKFLGAFSLRSLAVASIQETFSTCGGATFDGVRYEGTGVNGRETLLIIETEVLNYVEHL